jgi:chaperonin cofactor prefoldin
MFSNIDEFINKKFELIDELHDKINTLEKELKTLGSCDNKEHLLHIRRELYVGLYNKIPKSMGFGTERFRERRETKLKEFNTILKEFDTKYLLIETVYFNERI